LLSKSVYIFLETQEVESAIISNPKEIFFIILLQFNVIWNYFILFQPISDNDQNVWLRLI
jgi:hypothetical protein